MDQMTRERTVEIDHPLILSSRVNGTPVYDRGTSRSSGRRTVSGRMTTHSNTWNRAAWKAAERPAGSRRSEIVSIEEDVVRFARPIPR